MGVPPETDPEVGDLPALPEAASRRRPASYRCGCAIDLDGRGENRADQPVGRVLRSLDEDLAAELADRGARGRADRAMREPASVPAARGTPHGARRGEDEQVGVQRGGALPVIERLGDRAVEGHNSTSAPRSRSASGSTSRALVARARAARAGRRRPPAPRRAPSATERSGTMSGSIPCARSARRGARADRGDRGPASARASRTSSNSRAAPLGGSRTAGRSRRDRGAARRSGSIRIAGASMTRAPRARSRAASPLACARARVTAIVRPARGPRRATRAARPAPRPARRP